MNINRRKFFRFVAAGAAAITIPSFLRGDKVQGKIYEPSKPKGFYGYQEIGHAVLDNRRVLLGSFDEEDTEAMRKSMDTSGLWNIKAGRDYTTEELAKALETPLRMGVMSNDTIGKIFEIQELRQGAKVEFPLDFLAPGQEPDFEPYTIPNYGRIPDKMIVGDPVEIQVPTYDNVQPIDHEMMNKVREQRAELIQRKTGEEFSRGISKPPFGVHDEMHYVNNEIMQKVIESFGVPKEIVNG